MFLLSVTAAPAVLAEDDRDCLPATHGRLALAPSRRWPSCWKVSVLIAFDTLPTAPSTITTFTNASWRLRGPKVQYVKSYIIQGPDWPPEGYCQFGGTQVLSDEE